MILSPKDCVIAFGVTIASLVIIISLIEGIRGGIEYQEYLKGSRDE